MKLHIFNVITTAYLSYMPVVFSSLPSTSTISATEEEVMTNNLNRHLQETPVTPPLKCEDSDSELQLELETIGGSIIPFYCEWAKRGDYSCSETGALASHCPKTCNSCSRYRCADSEGRFLWKGKKGTCDLLATQSTSLKKKLCKNNPELATTCRATCNMCGDTNIRWEQTGQDIVGEGYTDRSGNAISLSADASTVAIGAPGNDDTGINAGSVRVYRQNVTSEEWEQIGQDIDGEDVYDRSGNSVSISADGNIVAIGAQANDGANSTDIGHVRVYKYDASYANGRWVQMGQDIDGDFSYGYSGTGLSLSADGITVAIGAPGSLAYSSKSHTRVYEYNTTSAQWGQKGQDIDGEDSYDYSGYSVSLSADGNRVAIGAPYNDGNDYYSGHVRIYEYNAGSDQWKQIGQDIDGEDFYNFSGVSVSLSDDGNRVAIGAPNNDGNNPGGYYFVGHVRIYEYNAMSDQWKQIGQDIDGENYYDDFSGESVSLSADGNRVAIGAPGNSDNGSYSGHGRIYEYNSGSDQWNQVGQDIDGDDYDDFSGESISISADGNTVAIGASESITTTLAGRGYVRIFHQAVY